MRRTTDASFESVQGFDRLEGRSILPGHFNNTRGVCGDKLFTGILPGGSVINTVSMSSLKKDVSVNDRLMSDSDSFTVTNSEPVAHPSRGGGWG